MKLYARPLATLLLVGCFTACEKSAFPASDAIVAPIRVQVQGFAIEQQPVGAFTRVQTVEESESVKFLTLAFFESGTNTEVYKQSQSRESLAAGQVFGEFSLSLPLGSYQLVVIANEGNHPVTLTSVSMATYGENNVKGTFVATSDVDITSSDQVSLSCTLERIVTALMVASSDARPADVTQMRFIYSKGGKAFNPLTGLAATDAGFTATMGYSDSAGTTTNTGGYLFLGADEETMDVTIQTLNAAGEVLLDKTVTDVPFKRNRMTKLSGSVYTLTPPGLPITLEINTTWLPSYELNL